MCPTQANKTTTNPTLFPLPLHNHASSLPYRISLRGFINSVEMALRVTVQNITDILLVHIPHDSFHDRNVLRSIHEPPSLPFCSDVFHWRCVQLRQYRPLERPRRKWKYNISTYMGLKKPGGKCVDSIHLALGRDKWPAVWIRQWTSRFHKMQSYLLSSFPTSVFHGASFMAVILKPMTLGVWNNTYKLSTKKQFSKG